MNELVKERHGNRSERGKWKCSRNEVGVRWNDTSGTFCWLGGGLIRLALARSNLVLTRLSRWRLIKFEAGDLSRTHTTTHSSRNDLYFARVNSDSDLDSTGVRPL